MNIYIHTYTYMYITAINENSHEFERQQGGFGMRKEKGRMI